MATPLLETKLYAPRPQRGVVARARLNSRLQRGADSRLTLVSAAAGFGKTTLLAELAASGGGRSVAWVSLDGADNDPTVFWSYVLVALDRAVPGIGTAALSLLEVPGRTIEAVVGTLVNDAAASPADVVLILDDYHAIDSPDVAASTTFFVERMPSNVHVVIGTRADPILPLSRLRVRGEVVEIRAADLRFSPDEAAAYLNGTMGLDLTDEDVRMLDGRTEGWIAALQLAALSMEGRGDVSDFIAGFAGDDRYVVDYLVEEVLHRQPQQVRNFLLSTSILSRMTGPLCEALTGQDRGGATLEAIERRNLFVVPLDDRRRWYRYHHLFADVLQAHLIEERPDDVAELHRRASAWYEQNGERSEAIRHAIAAGDYDRAAELVELALPALHQGRQETTRRQWLEGLPDELIRARPVLGNAYAGAILARGELDGVEARLRDVERWLELSSDTEVEARAAGMLVSDEDAFRALPSGVAVHRAGQARIAGDLAATVAHARRALELADEDHHAWRGGAAALLGLASWADGDLEAAYRWYADGMASLERAGYLPDVVGGGITLADIRMAQGRLGDALRHYERGLQLATGRGGPALRGAADMHTGMSDLFAERNELEVASRHLAASRKLGDENGLPRNPGRWRVAAARLRRAEGDLDGAIELLDDAERLYVADFSPDFRPVAALRARVRIAQGKLTEAWAWARDHAVTSTDELSYGHEFEHATLARLLLAQGRHDGADDPVRESVDLTEHLLAAAEAGGRHGSAIDILVVHALARHALHDVPGALAALHRAVRLAEPEGYVRVFLDEGPPMAALLKLAAKDGGAPAYVRRLLTATVTADRAAGVEQPLIEPLSDRELEVLRLLGTDLDGPEIARALVVSLNTVRTHTKNVYAKLGVNSRRAAVRRASELDLLPSGQDRPTP